jgi:oligopeptide transport system substrate-binding protein
MRPPRRIRCTSRGSAFPATLACVAVALVAAALSASAADPKKVIRYASPSAESKLDPAAESDEASGSISHVIFDPLLSYDFLARPAKLKPNAAVALPEVADEGATYTLRI